jgi:hypothetical protein
MDGYHIFMLLHDNATRQKVIMRTQDGPTTEFKRKCFLIWVHEIFNLHCLFL